MTDFGRPPPIQAARGQAAFRPIEAQVFDDGQATYTSAEIDVTDYRRFMLHPILDVTLSPINIIIEVLVSYDGLTFEKYTNGPFGSLMYGPTPAAIAEAVSGEIVAPKMKIRATATGVSAANKFTLTVKIIASR